MYQRYNDLDIIAEVLFNKEVPEYLCEPAKIVEEAKKLIEKGYSYECEIANKAIQENQIIQSGLGVCKSGPGEI